jgi:peptidoglycan/LPS O-acetylase OafA/YrhL
MVARLDIQGLRAIAVISVIVFHANKNWLPGGFVGVDIFFVISGYLISSIVLKQNRRGVFSFLLFYFSRAKRIAPAYFFLLAVVSLVFSVLLIPQDYQGFVDSLRSALLFTSNQFFAGQGDYFAPAAYETPLVHTWSLAVEMQFYLLLPVALVYVPLRFSRQVILIFMCVLIGYSAYMLDRGSRTAAYFSLFSRGAEFLIGTLLAMFPVTKRIGERLRDLMAIIGLLLIGGSCLFISEKSAFPGWLVLFPTVGALLVMAAETSRVSALLSNPVLVWIGGLSYSLYLWHWPILAGFRYFIGSYYLSWSALSSFCILTISCSYFSFRYIESPFRGEKNTSDSYHLFAFYGVLLFLSIWVSDLINKNIVPPLPVSQTRYAAPEEICHERIIGDCLRGDSAGRHSILMLGDSHAAQLNYFADEIGRAAGASIRVVSAANCITIPGFDVERIPEWGWGACRSHIQVAERYLRSADTIIIAGMWQFHVGSELFLKALDDFIKTAMSNNQRVLVLAQVPMLTSNVQRVNRFDYLGIKGEGVFIHPEWKLANQRIKDLVMRSSNATFVDFSQSEYFKTPPFYNGVLIYHDDNHLNELGARGYGAYTAKYFLDLLNYGRDDFSIERSKGINSGY